MIVLTRLQYLLAEYQRENGELPSLIAMHPDTHLALRRETPTFDGTRGYYSLNGIPIYPTNQFSIGHFALYSTPKISKLQ